MGNYFVSTAAQAKEVSAAASWILSLNCLSHDRGFSLNILEFRSDLLRPEMMTTKSMPLATTLAWPMIYLASDTAYRVEGASQS